MDNRKPYIYKTTDFGQTWTNITGDLPRDASARLRDVGGRESESAGHAVRRHRPRLLLLARRRRALDAVQGRPAARRRSRGSSCTSGGTTSSSRRTAAGFSSCATSRRSSRSDRSRDADVACSTRRIRAFARRAVAAPISRSRSRRPRRDRRASRSSTRAAQVVRTIDGADARGLNRATWDLRYDAPRVRSRCVRRAPDNPRIWEEPRFREPTDAADRPLGNSGRADERTDRACLANTRCGSRSTARPSRSVSTILKDPEIDDAGRRSGRVDAGAGSHSRRPERDRGHGEQARGHAQADHRSPESERRQVRRARRRLPSSIRRCSRSSCSCISRSDLHSDDKWYVERTRST